MEIPEVRLRRIDTPYSPDLWNALGPVWTELASRCEGVSAFQSPEWVGLWLQTFGPSLHPSAIVWTADDGSPAACVLYSLKTARVGPFRIVRLFLNATGDSIAETEHNDILALPEYRDRVLRDLVTLALESQAQELVLAGFEEETATTICNLWPGTKSDRRLSESPFVALGRLREQDRSYLGALSANTRANLRKTLRAYETQSGAATLQLYPNVAFRLGSADF